VSATAANRVGIFMRALLGGYRNTQDSHGN